MMLVQHALAEANDNTLTVFSISYYWTNAQSHSNKDSRRLTIRPPGVMSKVTGGVGNERLLCNTVRNNLVILVTVA